MDELGFDTLAVHAGDPAELETHGALDPSLVLSSTYAFRDAEDAAARFSGASQQPIYSRWGNPTVAHLEQQVAALEGAERAAAFSSGMGAMHAIVAAVVKSGDHVVSAASQYAETSRLLSGYFAPFGVTTTFIDATDAAQVAAAIRPETRLLVTETPANPTLAITDIAAVAARKGDAVLLVDSTFATPYHQRPLAFGADVVVHSATKALCGHGDAIGGVVAGRADLVQRAREVGVRTSGACIAPMNAWLIARGVRTLGLRMARASESALAIARWLSAQPEVERVYYPGLAEHPGHETAARQMTRGFGALVAFELTGGRDAGARLYDRVSLIARAVSLGDVRSLITHPASTTHASWTAEARRRAAIGEGLLRLSVGVEDVDDLIRDLEAALAAR